VSKLIIRQYKSAIGEKHAAQQTLESLGLKRPGNVVEREDSATLRGQLRKVAHLVHFETPAAPKAAPAGKDPTVAIKPSTKEAAAIKEKTA
jgi:large subunit ribosomal protein L30